MKPLDALAVPLRDVTLIEASAGTGKTWTLATLYLRLLVEQQLGVSQILVVTYTNDATAELRDRVRSRLREAVAVFEQAVLASRTSAAPTDAGHVAGLDPLAALVATCRANGTLDQASRHLAAALRGFDEAAIFTIHGFCQRILLENAFESGVMFDAELITDERPLCSEVVQDFWVKHLHDAPPQLVGYLLEKRKPEHLERLARRVLSSRDMPILPTDQLAFDHATLDAAVREWKAAVEAAADAWPGCSAAVEAALSDGSLHARSYPLDQVAQRCAALGESLATARAGLPEQFEGLDRFTTATLKKYTYAKRTTPQHAFFALCDRVLAADQALAGECERQALSFEGALVRHVGPEVRRRHEAANTQSFDDLLYRLRDALRADTARGGDLAHQIRERFRAALIDEFQDTDPVQYEIFRSIYQGTGAPLFLIGDPKQAIYAFRGADVFTYVTAKGDAGDSAHTLQTNHRSTGRLVEAVNALFSRVEKPFAFDEIPFLPVSARAASGDAPRDALGGEIGARPPLEILFVSDSTGEPGKRANKDWAQRNVPTVVAAEIVALLDARPTIGGRPLHAGDVAVLCRTNKQAVAIQKALRELAVPSVRQGDDSVFESEEAEEIERALRAVAEPGEPRLLRAALATRLVGCDATVLEALQRNETEWDRWAEHFREWLETWTTQGFMAAFRKLLTACETQRRLLALDDGERRLTNVLHVAELLQGASREGHRGPLALVDWLSLLRNDPAARADLASEAAQVRLESDEKAVQLVTIHRSKGLEYGVVYCPYTWDGADLSSDDERWVRFHDEDDERLLKLDLGSPEHDEHQERARLEAFAESLRLLYVAVTRARYRCTVVWSHVKDDELTPLGYLLHRTGGAGVGSLAQLVKTSHDRVKNLAAPERLEDLANLAAGSPDAITVREITVPLSPPPHPLAAHGEAPPVLIAPGAGPTLAEGWRVSSFSGLAASGGRSHKAKEGLDHDATAALDHDEPSRGEISAPAPIVLHDLPKGARTGELLHAILEKIDFQQSDEGELVARVREELGAFGFEARWETPIRYALDEVLSTPIPVFDEGTLTLADIPRGRRLNELQFLFGVRPGFDARGLARCFQDHPSAMRTDDYPERIRGLRFGALEGYLGGFIDLVFEHQGRWYVVDYKSNLLGTRAVDYLPERLLPVMSQHHYHLQYHLYVLAVQRYLTMRLAGFDATRDFGGVAYLFLRGMAPRHPRGCGVFFEQPHPALLQDLSALVGSPTSEATLP
jgi:exodeoxyribonuclease V beta subunit